MITRKEPTIECPRCGEISFEHTDTLVGQGKRTLEFTCVCGELGYFDEHLQRDGSSLKMTSLQTPEGGEVRRAFSSNPMMKYARGYFDE